MPLRPPLDPATPPVVPGYVLEELLGRGGSGEVWRARPRGGGGQVAVKVLMAGDPARQDREAALLGELDHPHLVRLVEVVHRELRGGGTQVALVLDLLAGGSLARLLARRGRLRPGEVVTAIAPVAAALAHAHDRGIVHGDLSPGNVVFTAEGRPVLTDLGVGRVLGQESDVEVTPAYVDPVVARGGAPGPASDVFGVAAAAFHALTGVPPWNAAGAAATLAVASAGQVPDLGLLAPDAPADLVEVIERGMSPHPHLRGTAAAFALDLRHACRPERIAMPRAGVDDALLAHTGQVPRTELTHQVRRPAGSHSAPVGRSRWSALRSGATRLTPSTSGVTTGVRRVAAAGVVLVALAGAGWVGVQWGQTGVTTPVPAARTTAVPSPPGEDDALGADPTTPSSTGPAMAVPGTTGPPTPTSGPTVSSHPVPAAAPVAAAPTAPDDVEGWQALVAGLYAARAEAFTDGDVERLTDVYAPASDLLTADVTELTAMTVAGGGWQDFGPVVDEVLSVGTPEAANGADTDQVVLLLVDRVPPYRVEDGSGRRTEVAGRGSAEVTMTLVRTAVGWRVLDARRLA